jgi:Ribosomal protein S3, C-terminal domain
MGNLINPIALRLGWVHSWEVSYFCKNLYYPHFLHLIYKYKLFLLSSLGTKQYEKGFGILFSHLEFVKIGRNFTIYIFTYQSSLEGFIQEFVIQEFWFIRNLIPNKRQYYDMRVAQKAVLFFLIYCMSFPHIDRGWNEETFINMLWPSGRWLTLIKSLNAFDDCIFWYRLMFGGCNKVLWGYRTRFLLWYSIFKQFMVLRHLSWWEALLEFCYWYLSTWGLDFFFRSQSSWFIWIGKFLFNINSTVVWYRITNNEITPKFLATFLGRKLKQNFEITALFNPIRRELQVLMGVLELGQQNLMKKEKVHLKFGYKQLLKNQFLVYYKFFNQEYYFFFLKSKTWITCEDLHFICWWKRETKFLLRLVRTRAWLTLLKKKRFLFDAKSILQKITFFYYWGKNVIFSFYLDKDFMESWAIFLFTKYVGRSVVLFKNFFKFIWIENSNQLVKMLKLNKLKLRHSKITQPLNFGLSGFKVQFVGRFSRKQRASSIFFQHGCLPLNTISADITYATFTIPLKNSAITVKVWFYQTKFVYSPYVQLH